MIEIVNIEPFPYDPDDEIAIANSKRLTNNHQEEIKDYKYLEFIKEQHCAWCGSTNLWGIDDELDAGKYLYFVNELRCGDCGKDTIVIFHACKIAKKEG